MAAGTSPPLGDTKSVCSTQTPAPVAPSLAGGPEGNLWIVRWGSVAPRRISAARLFRLTSLNVPSCSHEEIPSSGCWTFGDRTLFMLEANPIVKRYKRSSVDLHLYWTFAFYYSLFWGLEEQSHQRFNCFRLLSNLLALLLHAITQTHVHRFRKPSLSRSVCFPRLNEKLYIEYVSQTTRPAAPRLKGFCLRTRLWIVAHYGRSAPAVNCKRKLRLRFGSGRHSAEVKGAEAASRTNFIKY